MYNVKNYDNYNKPIELSWVLKNRPMDIVQNCDSYINNTIVTNLQIALPCWARSGDVMCFLLGTDKPMELSWVLNKRQNDG
jgi:hypothetical protein